MNKSIATAIMITIDKNMSTEQIVSMYNALTGFGMVSESNLAYEDAVKFNIIRPDGTPHALYETIAALERLVERRVLAKETQTITQPPHDNTTR